MTKPTTQATARPWTISSNPDSDCKKYISGDGWAHFASVVVRVLGENGKILPQYNGQGESNAALIVESVNHFDDLKSILRRAVNDELEDNWKLEAEILLKKLNA